MASNGTLLKALQATVRQSGRRPADVHEEGGVPVTEWSKAEEDDGKRDVAALLRAALNGDQGGIEAVLDGAGDRGVRAIAETLLALAIDLMARLTGAVDSIEDDGKRAVVMRADAAVLLLAEPEFRAAVEANIARTQGSVISGE